MSQRANRVFAALHAAAILLTLMPSGAALAQAAPAQPQRLTASTADATGCNTVEKPLSAGGASIVPDTPGQPKSWQPPGGEITFTVRSFMQIPADAYVIVCFRWKRINEQADGFITARPVHLDLTDGGRLLNVTVVVPPNLRNPPSRFSGDGEYVGLYLVPLAEVRILVVGKDKDGNVVIAADVAHVIGITRPFWALLLAAFTVLAAFGLLSLISHRRLQRLGLGGLDPVIRIITTPDGYASLSQLQMVLWTFVVAGSAVYVMVLSGDLIEITSGTLVLLGISGFVTVGTQLHDSAQSAKAEAAGIPRQQRKPMWSDLIVNEANGQREIDVTRVQMLYFTLITAIFVVMRVLSTYVIPEIPQGFQILMGLSNAVYFGSKVAQPAANTAAANPPPANPPSPGADGTPPAQGS
jgi:hypothetical protein